MKKIIFALVMLLLASPAFAAVNITCAPGSEPNEVIISYDARTETELPRAFALDIQCDNDSNILEVTGLSADYIIYPGSIQIDAGGNVTDYGSIVCSSSYPGTLPGLDSNAVTIECGSLYAPAGSPANAPDPCGLLLSIKVETVNPITCLNISGNVVRAGSGGVVLEDPALSPSVTFPAPGRCCVSGGPPPNCTQATQCAGHSVGDATCDGSVNLGDLLALKAAWGATTPWTDPECCAHFDNSGAVNLGDLLALKGGWGSVGHTPSTLNQTCP
jgi:hypothetical protein